MGVRLFERHAANLRPTDTGKIIVLRAERIEERLRTFRRREFAAHLVSPHRVLNQYIFYV